MDFLGFFHERLKASANVSTEYREIWDAYNKFVYHFINHMDLGLEESSDVCWCGYFEDEILKKIHKNHEIWQSRQKFTPNL